VSSMPVVDADGILCGFIAERDVVSAVARPSAAPPREEGPPLSNDLPHLASEASEATVRTVMRPSVRAIAEDADVSGSLSAFFVNGMKRLPVTNDAGEVVGTLNRIDVLQALFEGGLSGSPD
jgi:CBS-domain-containing membrane protein